MALHPNARGPAPHIHRLAAGLLLALVAAPSARAVTTVSVDGHPDPVTLIVGETVTLRSDVAKAGYRGLMANKRAVLPGLGIKIVPLLLRLFPSQEKTQIRGSSELPFSGDIDEIYASLFVNLPQLRNDRRDVGAARQ